MSKLTVDQAIEEAAGALPDGYVIEVSVENGSAWVNMYGPDGSDVDFPECVDCTLAEKVHEAMYHAIRHASE